MKDPRVITAHFGPNAAIGDCPLFICEEGAEYEVVEVMESHITAGSDGGAVSLDVIKCDSAEALAAGESVLASVFNLKSTADTPVRKSTASGLASTLAVRTIKGGQRLDADFQGTLTALVGVCVTIILRLLRAGVRR